MKQRKLFIALILMVFLPFACIASGKNATDIMRKAASAVSPTSGISASFSVSGSYTLKGTIKASGKKFTVITGANSVWYNGKTLSTYNRHQNETTVTSPSAEELSEVNPLLYISSWESMFSASFSPKQPASGYSIVLSPKSRRSGIKKAIVTLSASYIPLKVVIRISSGETSSIAISGFKKGLKFSNSTFEYPSRQYPKAKIIKL